MTENPPLPVADEISAPWWEAAAGHRLVIAKCSRCERFSHPPDSVCPHCHHPDPQHRFERLSGAATVQSWIVIRQSFLPGFQVPFVLVDVALEEDRDVRLIGRLVDGPDEPLSAGDPVLVCFDDLAPGVSVPAFRLARPT